MCEKEAFVRPGALCAQQLKDDLGSHHEELPGAALVRPVGVECWAWGQVEGVGLCV